MFRLAEKKLKGNRRLSSSVFNGKLLYKLRCTTILSKYDEIKQQKKNRSTLTVKRFSVGTPGGIRTPDPLVRSQILYPAELLALSTHS